MQELETCGPASIVLEPSVLQGMCNGVSLSSCVIVLPTNSEHPSSWNPYNIIRIESTITMPFHVSVGLVVDEV